MASPGLINLQTDLTSLRYGSDKPYVTKGIGQAPGTQIGRQIQSRIDDTSRIAQMLIDKPGLKFLGNQALLQQVNIQDKLQKSRDKGKSLAGAIVKQGLETVKQTAKILGSTLAQVPVNGTGTHFVYAFRTDTYLQPPGGNTRSAFAQFFGAGGVEGAPLALQGKPIEGVVESNFGTTQGTLFTVNPDVLGKYSYEGLVKPQYYEKQNKPISDFLQEEDQPKAASQSGNPVAVPEGAVQTTASPNPDLQNPQNKIKSIPSIDISGSGLTLSDDNLGKQYTSEDTYTGVQSVDTILGATNSGSIQLKNFNSNPSEISGSVPIEGITGEVSYDSKNFNSVVEDFRNKQGKAYSFDYNSNKINREQRVNLGNQGKVSFDRSNYGNSSDTDTHDTLNKLNESATRIDGTADARDLAKLYFEIITPDGSTFLHFRAFIDSIDDSYNADWQGFKYVGRAENFYTYGGFDRDINVSFKIAAATRAEMKPLYRKMVYLASSTAPTYGEQGFMRGTLARMTIGSYIAQIPGVITSVKYSLIQDMPWEISMQNPEAGTDDDMQELPMGLQCSVSFKAIHDFAPQTGLQHYFTSPEPLNGSKSFLI